LISRLREQVTALPTENYNLLNDCDRLTRNAHEANDQNQCRLEALTADFQQSTSWRVTAPIRAASSFVRRRGRDRS
jgi:hypothetical protein